FTSRSLGGQIGNHLPDGGCGHEFLRRTSVPRVSGAMVNDANPPVGQHIDALNSADRRSLWHFRHRTTIRRCWRYALAPLIERVRHALTALAQSALIISISGSGAPSNQSLLSVIMSSPCYRTDLGAPVGPRSRREPWGTSGSVNLASADS